MPFVFEDTGQFVSENRFVFEDEKPQKKDWLDIVLPEADVSTSALRTAGAVAGGAAAFIPSGIAGLGRTAWERSMGKTWDESLQKGAETIEKVGSYPMGLLKTEQQKAARSAVLETALKTATEVPLEVAEACVAVMELCRPAAELGNVNAVSDAGVAVVMAEAGLRSAALNVLINLGWIADEVFVAQKRARLDGLLEGRPAFRDEVYEYVVGKL